MKKQLNIAILLAILIVFNFGLVAAGSSCTIVMPSDSATVNGTTQPLNISFADVSGNFSVMWYARSAGATANTTWALIQTVGNTTSLTSINTSTFNTNIFEDGADYVFNATCINGTATFEPTLTTGIEVNNTNPSVPTTLTPTSDSDGSVIFGSIVTGTDVTACTLFFAGKNPGLASYTMINTGNDCTVTVTSIAAGVYNYYIRATDGTDTSASSSTQALNVDIQTSSGKAVFLAQQVAEGKLTRDGQVFSIVGEDAMKIGPFPMWMIAVLVIIAVGVVIAVKKR